MTNSTQDMNALQQAEALAAEVLADEAWFNNLPASARDDLGDRNFARAQRAKAVQLARAVQSIAPVASKQQVTS